MERTDFVALAATDAFLRNKEFRQCRPQYRLSKSPPRFEHLCTKSEPNDPIGTPAARPLSGLLSKAEQGPAQGGWCCGLRWRGLHSNSEEQPHAIANTPIAEMRSPNADGEPVSVAGDAKRPLPDARRKVPRRSKG